MRLIVSLNIIVKVVLLLAVAYMFLFPDQPQFEAKSLTLRAVFYPLFSFIIAAFYFFKKLKGPYPHFFDFLWSFTFTLDIVGNDLGLYNSFAKFDDLVHFINAVPYMFVLFAILKGLEEMGKIKLGFKGLVLFALTIHTSLHAIWEMWEYSMDRFFGTVLQPGGMTEATENNLFGILGSFVGVWFLYLLRKSPFLQLNLLSPAQNYLTQLLRQSEA